MASNVVHLGYYVALVGAYKHGELGLTYPVMRGLAPLLVATASAALIGEALGRGLGRRAGGERGRDRRSGSRAARWLDIRNKALRYALANAAIIALYTVIDGLGVRASGNALAYVATLFLFEGLPIWRWCCGDAARRCSPRSPCARALASRAAGRGRFVRLLCDRAVGDDARAGRAGGGAARNLGAVRRAAGALWLKEGFGALRIAGTLAVLAGVMALRWPERKRPRKRASRQVRAGRIRASATA